MLRKINSFVRRSGRLTNAQKYALEQYAPEYLLTMPLDFELEFWHVKPVIMEIGFGNGTSLVQMCKECPDTHYLGVEVYLAGVGSIMHHAHEQHIQNLKVINHDAIEVIQTLPKNSLSAMQLYFPDPWHKKKHHKRRIVSLEFMSLILPKLKDGANIHMATDWEEYAYQMLEVLTHTEGVENIHPKFAPEINRPHTKFEARGERLGHGIWDLEFKVVKSAN